MRRIAITALLIAAGFMAGEIAGPVGAAPDGNDCIRLTVNGVERYVSQSCTPTTTTTTTVPPTTTATTTTTTPTTTTTLPGGLAFSDTFSGPLSSHWSLSRWRQEQSFDPGYLGPASTVCGVANALPPNDAVTCNGQLVVSNASQNYGDLYLRADQQFDITGRTGTVSLDMTTSAEWLGGYPVLLFTDGPYSAPSYDADNAAGPGPANGLLLQFSQRCIWNSTWVLAPQVRTWTNYVMSAPATPTSPCTPTSNSTTALDHIVVRISTSAVDITANGATWFHADVGAPARSFVHLGVHNHATVKYNYGPAGNARFDNFSFDGPVIAPVTVSQVADRMAPDGAGVNIAYLLPTPVLSLPSVPANPKAATLTLSMQANRGSDLATSRLNFRLNGGTWHAVAVQDMAARTQGSTFTFQIPVDVAELVAGNNTVEFSKTGFAGGWTAAVGNVDLIAS